VTDVDWRRDGLVLADLRRRRDAFPAPCRVGGIPNARLARDRTLLKQFARSR